MWVSRHGYGWFRFAGTGRPGWPAELDGPAEPVSV